MFFPASKLFWILAQPTTVIALLLTVSVLGGLLAWRKTSVVSGLLALSLFLLLGWTTAGALMLKPLEQRFARPAVPPERVAGIVVLGGAFEGGINKVRGGYELNDAGDRMTEAAVLALRYPDAKLLVSGGSGTIVRERAGDGDTAPLLFTKLGIGMERILLDPQSRNTAENAEFSKTLADPQPGETWLLVTSAFHMPRSMGLFRQAGFDVVAWPTDYRTEGDEGLGLCRQTALICMGQANMALREWAGLAAYRATNKIGSLFPSPE